MEVKRNPIKPHKKQRTGGKREKYKTRTSTKIRPRMDLESKQRSRKLYKKFAYHC